MGLAQLFTSFLYKHCNVLCLDQARAIISLGFPQGAGRPSNPSRHLVMSTRDTVAPWVL